MTVFLTGSPTRYGEDHFTEDNGFLADVRAALSKAAGPGVLPRVLLVSAAPDDRAFTDSVLEGMSLCIHRSGIRTQEVVMLDRRNAAEAPYLVANAHWIVLCGGHVPTQNRFIHEIGLRELLQGFDGVVMGCSAGSMNCASRVYSHPELPGEAVDPGYRRSLEGLGLTDINLVPHYYQVKDVWLDGKRLFEDIVFPDSWQHRFYTLPDGGYIKIKDGRSTLHGDAWEISDGRIRQVSHENSSYSFMNLIFISPHFPETYWHFCAGAKANGINVLGIADAPYEQLSPQLKDSLTEYYRVRNLEDYDEVFRAVAFLSYKYGKIDWIESNNEYWLEQDARLRTDFNVTTGIRTDRIASIKNKSEMKKYYALGGIPTARQVKGADGADAIKAFARKAGYPLIAKPDNGVGASDTSRIESAPELEKWLEAHSGHLSHYVIEEFISGLLVSYDAIYNDRGEPVFENNSVFPTPVMDIVHQNLDTCYWTNRTVPAKLAQIGRRTVKAFGITSRFVHLEFFQLDRDREGLGRKGDYVGLEVNMRPPGGFTPDMMNFAHSTDVYQIWADMIAFGERRKSLGEQFYCAYAGRRDCHSYRHSHEEIMSRYGADMCMCTRMSPALADDLGDQVYIARFREKKEIERFFAFLTEA
ncbi:MAG: Type 1 glutamine amidotransferase-like domain-containing protein [Bacteroidales bacterium]|nr:Type 1 glutamine amidotransferase-like domain-containing protein [Bacteroidales bacterium]